jgi:hypothetical protein
MVNDGFTFTIRDDNRTYWDKIVLAIPRRFYNERKGKYENLSIEGYLKKLLEKISSLKKEEIVNLINNDYKVEVVKK